MKLTGEAAEQARVVKWLRRRGALFFHVPNESDVPVQYRLKLRALGLLPGASDLIIIDGPPLRIIACEMKTRTGAASHAQREFIAKVEARGGVGRVCRGAEEAIAWLTSLGL